MGRSPDWKSIAPLIVFGLMMISEIIVIIVLSITDTRYNATTDLVTRVFLPLLLVPLLGFSGIIIQRIKRKREEKWHQTEHDDLIQETNIEKDTEEVIKLVLEPVVFQGDLENQVCSLCKKDVKEGHVVLICPRCASLFHHDHLLDWLKDNPLCPVCDEDL